MIQNLDRINIIKRNMVKQSVEIASKCSDIERVVVFGSSVREDCHEDSDIDFCFYVSKGHNKRTFNAALREICAACGYLADTLRADLLQGTILDTIQNEGVVVYDRLS